MSPLYTHSFSRRSFILLPLLLLSFNQNVYAQEPATSLEKKSVSESVADDNPYAITLYQPTYIMPFSYTSNFSKAAAADTSDNQKLDHYETQFQFSVKVSALKNIFNYRNSLNIAYTQLSFWQVYNDSPFFRETSYQPEIFFENDFDKILWGGWHFQILKFGYLHDSNGRGGNYERSWNRAYGETIFSKQNWMVSLRPWYVIHDEGLKENNPNIAKFLGHERVVIAYKIKNNVLSLQTYNLERVGSRSSEQLTWSFPLIKQLRGYVQLFDGYGQSLIDYTQHASSASLGIALNDWL